MWSVSIIEMVLKRQHDCAQILGIACTAYDEMIGLEALILMEC